MALSYYAKRIVILPITTLSVAYFGYGLYVLLLLVQCNIRDSKKYRGRDLYTAMTVALFLFATISNITSSVDYVQNRIYWVDSVTSSTTPSAVVNEDEFRALLALQILSSVLSNVLVEVVLLHRVYTLWNEKVAIPHAPFLLIINLIGVVGGIIMTVTLYYAPNDTLFLRGRRMLLGWEIAAAVITFWISILIGLKIWKASSRNQKIFPLGSVILDSGILYPICMVIDLILYGKNQENNGDDMVFFFTPFLTEMAGITVAIILVRSSLGRFRSSGLEDQDLAQDGDLATLAPPDQGTVNREHINGGQFKY